MSEFITASERDAAKKLQSLPDSWTVICNKEIVSPAGVTYEIDFVIIADHLVFVIDEKSWSGDIYGNENIWVLPNGESRRSPLQKIGHVARQLAGALRGRVPYLFEHAQDVHFVQDLILLSGEPNLRVADPRVGGHVVRLTDALEELPRLDREHQVLDLTLSRSTIRTVLTDLKNRPKFPQNINVYKIKEVLPAGRACRVFLAQHRDGSERLLKLYELSPVEQPREAVIREYNAIRTAAAKGVSPDADPYFLWNDDRYLAIPFRLPQGSALRRPAEAGLLQEPQYALDLAGESFRQLSVLSQAGLVHRRIDPDSVYVHGVPEKPVIQFFQFGYAHIDERQTIADELDDMDKDNPYLSPECRIGFALGGPESDVYGLAISICTHLTTLEPSREEAENGTEDWMETALRTPLKPWPPEISDPFIDLFRACAASEPRERPSASQVAQRVKEIAEKWQQLRPARGSSPKTFANGQYRLIRVLGEGATAVTYLVEDVLYGGHFVLKRIKNQAAVQRHAKTEFNALKDLVHPNLPRVYDVRSPQDEFHLKLEYIPGAELTHTMGEYRFHRDRVLHLAEALLSALAYLEDHGIVHRDISPKNIIVPDDEEGRICLIDFGLAKLREDMRQSAVGTPLYRDPEVERSGWKPTSDLYSVAVVLYEALTGRLPFVFENGVARREVPQPLPREEEQLIGPPLLACLRRAAGPVSGRYPDARVFLERLQEAVAAPVPKPVRDARRTVLDWVRDLRGLYRNSASGNADNRGLDSDFARQTYVPTMLDRRLLPDIVAGNKRLVFLTGNPGDGKTAFLEMVRDRFKELGSRLLREDRYGWALEYSGAHFEAIFDASESRGDRSSEEILCEAFSPFAGDAAPRLEDLPVLLVAINDGRLHEFFREHRPDYSWLGAQIDTMAFGGGVADGRLALVDLKRRALVQLPGRPASLFSLMLAELTSEQRWHACGECSARPDCPIRFNAVSLADPQIISRLELLFLVQHWRRNRRATIRDVRSALAYFITGNLSCEDVHATVETDGRGPHWPYRAYFHAAFNALGENDEMLQDLGAVDPAQRANPRLDRFLHFHRHSEKWHVVLDYMLPVNGRTDFEEAVSPEALDTYWQGAIKRRLYFEADNNKLESDRWELPASCQLLPYLYLDDFVRALTGDLSGASVLARLLAGISRSEGVTRQAAGGKLSLALARNQDQELTVIKQFDPEEFRCRVVTASDGYVECVPDALELFHVSGDPSLEITLDMFELLSRLAEGYTPETQEFEPFLVELREFKSRLLRRGVKEVLLLEGRSRLHRVVMENNVIELREAL
jgi:serine/threonine protein kinase